MSGYACKHASVPALRLDISYCISPRVTALLSSFRAANRYSHSRAASRHSMLIPVVVAKACPDMHASMHPSLLCDWTYTIHYSKNSSAM